MGKIGMVCFYWGNSTLNEVNLGNTLQQMGKKGYNTIYANLSQVGLANTLRTLGGKSFQPEIILVYSF